MIYLSTQTADLYNEICEEIRLFLDCDKIELVDPNFTPASNNDLLFLHTTKHIKDDQYMSTVCIANTKYTYSYAYQTHPHPRQNRKNLKFAVKLSFYYLLKFYTKRNLPWGCLTGIRPTKMLRDLIQQNGEEHALSYMKNTLDISEQKLNLAYDIMKRQSPIISTINDNSIDIYINIPFCPSICAYCSFASTKITHGQKLQHTYIDCLTYEIKNCLYLIKGKEIRSIYIGGGTPTSLDYDLLKQLLELVKISFNKPLEYTVEAGRPDTLSKEILLLLKQYDVDRISINPQTLKQKTLNRMSREHTIKQFYDAYALAKSLKFDNINIDLIFGLPKENAWDMRRSLKKVLKLNPQSITIHTLAIKNSSKLKTTIKYQSKKSTMNKTILWSQKACTNSHYQPYYMYRQKYMKGNLENVGFTKKDHISIYNIDMMEEVCSVIAFGAGAISKHVQRSENRINRSPNIKDVKTYISRHKDMVDRKNKLFQH